MLILHQKIQAFTWMWNCHTIHKQSNQFHAVHRKSYMLYNWSQTSEVQKMSLKSDAELLSQLKKQTAMHDMLSLLFVWFLHLLIYILDLNEYLSEIIKKWCDVELKKLDYRYIRITASEYFSDDTRVHCSVYLQLQAAVQTHIVSEKKSHLSKCKKSEESWNWNADVSTINVKSTDFSEEKENSLVTSSDFVENLEDLED